MRNYFYRLIVTVASISLCLFLNVSVQAKGESTKYIEYQLSNNASWQPSLYDVKINSKLTDISWKQNNKTLSASLVELDNGDLSVYYSVDVLVRGKKRKSYIASRTFQNNQTWSKEKKESKLMNARALAPSALRTKNGDLHLFFIGVKQFEWKNGNPTKNNRSDLWTVVSKDDGKTWSMPKIIFKGYTGATNGAIETSSGDIVVPFSHYVSNPGRLVSRVVYSKDSGKSYSLGQKIDLGGQGDHSGAIEPTIVEVSPNKIWMLIRTTKGEFWKAYSINSGQGWYNIGPSSILSAGAPGSLIKLNDGRVLLAWNPNLKPKKAYSSKRRELLLNRHELWLSEVGFLDDDNPFLIEPFVVATGKQASYPSLYQDTKNNLYISFHDVALSWKNTRVIMTKLKLDNKK